jgi:hypothetical protein
VSTIPLPDWIGAVPAKVPKVPRARTVHDELVERARAWLRRHNCKIVFTEMRCYTAEQPDAIGWKEDGSFLIECKTSRSDFAADRRKPFREVGGVGDWRYILTPPSLVAPVELPAGWGLLYAHPRSIEVVSGFDPRCHDERKTTFRHQPDYPSERRFLLSALRRLQLHHGEAAFHDLVHASYASKHTPGGATDETD